MGTNMSDYEELKRQNREKARASGERPRKMVPPLWLLLSLVFMVLLDRYHPVAEFGGPFVWGFALSFGFAGLVLAFVSVGLFKRAKTAVVPFATSTALVTDGPYKLTRNPMYLAMTLLLIGVAMYLGSLLPFLVIIAFVVIIQKEFIEGEERFMEAIFGEEYLAYKAAVRRWI